jgi:hypothetical protein
MQYARSRNRYSPVTGQSVSIHGRPRLWELAVICNTSDDGYPAKDAQEGSECGAALKGHDSSRAAKRHKIRRDSSP